jgi:hypothetical protein
MESSHRIPHWNLLGGGGGGMRERERERWGGVSSKQRPKQLHTEHHDDDDI